MSHSNGNLYIDCTNGISGDMLCQGLTALSGDKTFVEEQQQLISDGLHHEAHHDHDHDAAAGATHVHGSAGSDAHAHPYTHRSYQSLIGLIDGSRLDDGVKAMTKKIYQILATAEAEVHGETLETVHFHEVGRPQAIINMVGIAAAFQTIHPAQVYCGQVIDGCGTVQCAHGEIPVPVPAVRALMNRSTLEYGTCDKSMEMVTPTGLAALLAMEPKTIHDHPEPDRILDTATAKWGLKIVLFS
jgi:pyridinium-3,5-bisthiocarboxylic acid mononucleotide nickel chelatase